MLKRAPCIFPTILIYRELSLYRLPNNLWHQLSSLRASRFQICHLAYRSTQPTACMVFFTCCLGPPFTENSDGIWDYGISWWRHEMETSSALLALGEGNPPVTGGFPSQRPVTGSLDVVFDVHLNKRLNKQWTCWWFETPRCSCDVTVMHSSL